MKKIVFLLIAFFSAQAFNFQSLSAQILFVNAYNRVWEPHNAFTYNNSTAPIFQYIVDINKYRHDHFLSNYINRQCLAYFLDTAYGKKIKFSSVTIYDYRAKDSMHHKKLQNKCTMQFNENGQMTYLYNINHNGKVTDSERMCYNEEHKLLSDIQYTTDAYNSKKKINKNMQKIQAEYHIYATNGREIKDSLWYISGSEEHLGAPCIRDEYKTYDSAGNKLTDIIAISSENREESYLTDYTIYKYDDLNRVIEENYHSTIYSSRITHYKYDSNTNSNKVDIMNNNPSLSDLVMPSTNDSSNEEKESWLRNQKGKLVSHRTYDSSYCGSIPYETDNYVYYPDSVSLKKHIYTRYDKDFNWKMYYCIASFGEDSRILKYICTDYIYLDYREIVYEYKK
jgi:hypothetical protein